VRVCCCPKPLRDTFYPRLHRARQRAWSSTSLESAPRRGPSRSRHTTPAAAHQALRQCVQSCAGGSDGPRCEPDIEIEAPHVASMGGGMPRPHLECTAASDVITLPRKPGGRTTCVLPQQTLPPATHCCPPLARCHTVITHPLGRQVARLPQRAIAHHAPTQLQVPAGRSWCSRAAEHTRAACTGTQLCRRRTGMCPSRPAPRKTAAREPPPAQLRYAPSGRAPRRRAPPRMLLSLPPPLLLLTRGQRPAVSARQRAAPSGPACVPPAARARRRTTHSTTPRVCWVGAHRPRPESLSSKSPKSRWEMK
jgi:hypothetical protein